MEKCLYCKKQLDDKYVSNKVGKFCNQEHYEKFFEIIEQRRIY